MFKEFDLPTLFDISTTKSVDKNKLDFVNDGEYDFIGRTTVDWGIQGKLHKLSFEPNPKDSFSLIQVGETVALWREREWYASQNLFLLNPKINEIKENKLYFQSAINKEMSRYGKEYNSYPTLKSLTVTKIILPVIENSNPNHEYTVDDIDWQYMRDYITKLERERITELDAYLQATGLNNYELTEDDKKILSLSTERASNEDGTLEDNSENEVRFGSFKLGQLFESQTGDVDLQQKDVNDKGYFFINSGVENRGIKGKTNKPARVFKAGTITIDFWGNAYYRDFDYVMATHNHVFSLSGDVIKNEKVGHYIIGKLSKLPQSFSYNNMATWNKLKVLDISLPIKSNAPDDYTVTDIDFDYMERYIRAIEKIIIADVIKYKNKIIKIIKI